LENFLKISTGANVMPLLLALRRRPECWKDDTYLRTFPQGPFEDMESVILRFPERAVIENEAERAEWIRTHDQHENIDQPIYAQFPEARPLVRDLMAFVSGERLGRVMINKIRPGGKIFPHADTPSHADYWRRFHIVLHSRPGVVFKCGDEQTYMATGECWWFNNKLVHEVINNSGDDRIHMIVDVRCSL
jgi:hypothetical protein